MSTTNAYAHMSTADPPHKDQKGKLNILLPHVVLASACLIFLALNFWYYRRNNYERYQRKVEKIAHAMLSRTPRRVTSMMRYSDPKVFNVCTGYNLVRNETGQEEKTPVSKGMDLCRETPFNAVAGKQVPPTDTDLCKREPLPMIAKTRSISLFTTPTPFGRRDPLQSIYNTS